MKSNLGNSIVGVMLVQLLVVGLLLGSWVVNLVKFCKSDFKAPIKREVIHGIGLIPPISAITCWFNIDESAEAIEVKIVE